MNTQVFSLLKTAVWALLHAHPVGTQDGGRHDAWFRKLSPGDMVMEFSTVWHNAKDDIRFGELLRVGEEFFHSDEEWESVKDQYLDCPRPAERVFWIRLLKDGTEMRWRDCDFIRIPKQMDMANWFHIVGASGREIPPSLLR